MFTGLVEALGTVRRLDSEGPGKVLEIVEAVIAAETVIGESVAINGVCLTVIHKEADWFRFQAGPETLARTNLGNLKVNDRVNLERSLQVGDRLGGHIVQGHVDGMGHIDRRDKEQDWEMIWFKCSTDLAKQMIPKGSVAVDGISLTLVDVVSDGFSVALIPHTLAVTTLGWKQTGDSVNLETDLFGKYVLKYVQQMKLSEL